MATEEYLYEVYHANEDQSATVATRYCDAIIDKLPLSSQSAVQLSVYILNNYIELDLVEPEVEDEYAEIITHKLLKFDCTGLTSGASTTTGGSGSESSECSCFPTITI